MKTIFFDFDGTIADTSRGIVKGYQYAYSSLNLPIPDEGFIKKNIGPPLKDTLRLLSNQYDEDTIDKLAIEYRKYFSSTGLFEMDFYDGIFDLLKNLSNKAVLGIVSSKPLPFIVEILKRNELSEYFTYITGVSLEFNNKPKRVRLDEMIVDNNLSRSDCIMIGDRGEDAESARYAKIRFIGVLYGFGNRFEMDGCTTADSVTSLRDQLEVFCDEESLH